MDTKATPAVAAPKHCVLCGGQDVPLQDMHGWTFCQDVDACKARLLVKHWQQRYSPVGWVSFELLGWFMYLRLKEAKTYGATIEVQEWAGEPITTVPPEHSVA